MLRPHASDDQSPVRLSVQLPDPLPGYVWGECLYQGAKTVVYRAVETATGRSVVIKYLNQEYPSFGDLVQFRNQYAVTKNLSIPGVVRPVALEPFGNSYALVMEDVSGISLETYAQQQELDLIEVLGIALQLTDILHNLYQQRVIHKDIKLANILIHPDSKRVSLIDFSIASLLPKETQAIQSPKNLEGTLAYIAPEQTGRMNRAIDYRTDFYALGVSLYQLLTGQLPFTSDDPMELIHCHMAQVPVTANQVKPGVPAVVGAIAAKLMAKNAEDRYQSALGLKHDLAQCLSQWKEKGEIAKFELGQRDVSDRFTIPEKLYGREAEVQSLLDAFDRVSHGASELMLVAGFSGIGKTAVINEIHKPITQQKGYFIKGKFDQFNRNIPLSAFVQAFRDLVGQLLSESDAELQSWKSKILEALGENAQIIIDIVPELEQIIGRQPPAPELSGASAQNRFNYLFQRFTQVFNTAEHPLVMFVDDLQWADSASLNLIQVLMTESQMGHFLMLGAYRDNEVFPVHPLMLTLDDMAKTGAAIHTITLQPLSFKSLNLLIADTLHAQEQAAQPLTELIMQKTQGNPFFSTQFLNALHQEQLLTFDNDAGYWQCDIVKVHDLALTDDVVKFMAIQLQRLPESTQKVLKLAACLGAQFDLETLSIISRHPRAEVATALWDALQQGFILPRSDFYKFFLGEAEDEQQESGESLGYRFLHDRIQQAAYSLIAHSQCATVRLEIGRSLYQQNHSSLFTVVDNYNQGIDFIDESSEQLILIKLNLSSAKQAKASTAYEAAADYLKIARHILKQREDTASDLYFQVYFQSIEVDFSRSQFPQALDMLETVQQSHPTTDIKLRLSELRIKIYIAQLKFKEAIEIGLQILEENHIELCSADEITTFKDRILGTNPLTIQCAKHPQAEIIGNILWGLEGPAIFTDPSLYFQIVLTRVKLMLAWGYTLSASTTFVSYGFCLALINDYDAAYQVGQSSFQVLGRFPSRRHASFLKMIFGSYISAIKDSLSQGCRVLKEGLQDGLESGELEYMGYCANAHCALNFLSGQYLDDVAKTQALYIQELSSKKLQTSWTYSQFWYQCVKNLLTSDQMERAFDFEEFDEPTILQELLEKNSGTTLYAYYLSKGILHLIFSEWTIASSQFQQAQNYAASIGGYQNFVLSFYYSLALLRDTSADMPLDLRLETVSQNQNRLAPLAQICAENYQHKFDLVEAEKYRLLDQKLEAIDYYERAISGAKAHKFLQEEALANELFAQFYLDWKREAIAAVYMQEAYYCYSRWGATAKVADLENHYPGLLGPILQPSTSSSDVLTTLMTIAAPTTATIHASTCHAPSNNSLNQTLDFASVLKTSQALAGTIELNELLHQLTQIILQTSGGDRCAILLVDKVGDCQLRAQRIANETQLCTEPLTEHSALPVKLLQYVKNTQAAVTIDELDTDLPIIDDYLAQHQPKSILGLPILNQGDLIGLLYLQNSLVSGAFTTDRVLVLNFLCAQAAISLENARLYQKAQRYAEQLEASQLQIVQNEKMATLGNLVAGVAHEINNPIGFLNGSIQNGKDYVSDLFEYIETYQQKQPPNDEMVELAEELDIEFLQADLPKLLTSMQAATDRIKGISTSLRNFSRADTEHKVSANLHDGLDSTLLILKYRLKANENRPAIEVIQDYGDLPKINCFSGQLNQVFMNILANAIDMFDDMAHKTTFAALKQTPQKITITTEQITEQQAIEIRISDNGKGMPDEVKSRIFDHLFTTKGVGKGTGLGLAIAHQIVTETHSGSLEVNSEVGQGTEFCIRLPI